MKQKILITLCFLLTRIVGWAQQPHTVIGYAPKTNTLTALRYGYGNSLEKITVAGQTQTTIVVSGNGQPKSISNGLANVNLTFAGTSSVTVDQTVNGETKTEKVSISSDKVLALRKEFSEAKAELSGVVGNADAFLRNGGAKLIGNILSAIGDGLSNPINMCFQQALDAAKNTKDPIIPIDCLEALAEATKKHESAGDEIKGAAVDYIFQNYGEWTDKWSDLVYEGMMKIDQLQQAENKKKQQERITLAQQLLSSGTSTDELAQQIDMILNGGSVKQSSGNKPATTARNSGTTPSGSNNGGQNSVSRNNLETTYFYFDNPDGTIESYPEYTYKRLSDRMMSISSSKYATPLKGEPEGALKKYENLINLLFARQTRTTVFVFDGQESAKAAMMTTAIYSSTLLGLWAALEEAMREKLGKALDDARIPHTTSATWRNAIKQGKPEELLFNGHEGGHIVNRIDLSQSWLSLFAGADIEMVFDMYFYHDEEYDKLVGVVFSYSETKNPVGKYASTAYGAIKSISAATGYNDPTTNQTTLASMFERHDMIDYFKKHFHLKRLGKTNEPQQKCIANFIGTGKELKIDLCGDTIDINIEEITHGDPPTQNDSTVSINPAFIDDPTGTQPPQNLPYTGQPITGQPDLDTDIDSQSEIAGLPRSAKKFAVIQQGVNYESIDKPFAENDKYVFFMQPAHMDNAVLAVDKQTGILTEIVPGKRKGKRPNIISMGAYGSDLYLDVQGLGVVRYNGNDVQTSEVLFSIDRGFMDNYKTIVFSPNGRYLAYSGLNCTSYVYDLQEKKIIKRFNDGLQQFLVTDEGDFYGANNFRAVLYRNNGDSNADIEISALFNSDPVAIRQIGNEIYLVGGNKVVKTPVKDFKWTEAVSLTGNRLKLRDAALSRSATGFSYVSDSDLNRFAHFSTNNSVPSLQKKLNTGINVERSLPLTVEIAQNIHIDQFGNIWMVENTGTYFVVIYNPKGIVGLKNLAGKFIKQTK